MMEFIEIRSVYKEYATAVALRGVDMTVERGRWCSIVGPSGSGKSTLLNILGGLDSPTGGEVFLDGTGLTSLGEDALARFRRENIGFIFQQSHLVPYLNSVENVMLAQYFHSMTDEAEAVESLKRVALGHRLNHRPSELSGGEQQRVCIARALINSPKILLADEPTGNLDRENTRLILELLKTLHSEEHFTILLVTHDPYVSKWSERILTMEDGRIIKDEPLYY
jgi:putative ABC transport system ATP-binding protein